jgi:copper chaperone NosL
MIGLLLVLVSCGNRSLRPVEIDSNDVCVQCKMAISEKRYAAELADADGNIFVFDSVDCLTRYAAEHGSQAGARGWWVMDSKGREWLDVRQAMLVRSGSIPGPMGSGVLAVKSETEAEALATRFSGRIIRFDDLWKTSDEVGP